jgi:hypothetical protein
VTQRGKPSGETKAENGGQPQPRNTEDSLQESAIRRGERHGAGSPSEPPEGTKLLIVPEPSENKFLLLSASQIVVASYSSSGY